MHPKSKLIVKVDAAGWLAMVSPPRNTSSRAVVAVQPSPAVDAAPHRVCVCVCVCTVRVFVQCVRA